MRFVTYILLYLSLSLISCRALPGATTEPQSTRTQPPSAVASPVAVVDTFVWEQLQNESPVPITLYRPTFLPPQYIEAKLEDISVDSTGEPSYTVVYKAPDAILAFILGNGAGSLGNFPPLPQTTIESFSIEDHPATLIVVQGQSPPTQAMDVTWQDQGNAYTIRCFGNACDIADLRQIALSMRRVDP